MKNLNYDLDMHKRTTWLNRLVSMLLLMISIVLGSKNCWSASSITARENLDILIKTNSCRNCDLSGLNLNRMDLSGADLEGADLSLTKLFLVNLSQANLTNTKLNGAVFGGADLGDADLRGADLRGANLEGAYLEGARLDGKFITATPYADAGIDDLEKEVYIADPVQPKKKPEKNDIQLAKPRFFSEPPPSSAMVLTETGQDSDEIEEIAKYQRAPGMAGGQMYSLPKAPPGKILTAIAPVFISIETERAGNHEIPVMQEHEGGVPKSEFDNDENIPYKAQEIAPVVSEIIPKPLPTIAKIDVVSIIDDEKQRNLQRIKSKNRCYACDLSGLNLSGKNLENVDLEKANLSNINFQGADLAGANLKGSNLQGANLKEAILRQADLYRANLSDADFTGADVSGAMFDDAKMNTAVGLDNSPAAAKP